MQWSDLPEVKPSLSRQNTVTIRALLLDRVGVFIVATQYQLFKQTD